MDDSQSLGTPVETNSPPPPAVGLGVRGRTNDPRVNAGSDDGPAVRMVHVEEWMHHYYE